MTNVLWTAIGILQRPHGTEKWKIWESACVDWLLYGNGHNQPVETPLAWTFKRQLHSETCRAFYSSSSA